MFYLVDGIYFLVNGMFFLVSGISDIYIKQLNLPLFLGEIKRG